MNCNKYTFCVLSLSIFTDLSHIPALPKPQRLGSLSTHDLLCLEEGAGKKPSHTARSNQFPDVANAPKCPTFASVAETWQNKFNIYPDSVLLGFLYRDRLHCDLVVLGNPARRPFNFRDIKQATVYHRLFAEVRPGPLWY